MKNYLAVPMLAASMGCSMHRPPADISYKNDFGMCKVAGNTTRCYALNMDGKASSRILPYEIFAEFEGEEPSNFSGVFELDDMPVIIRVEFIEKPDPDGDFSLENEGNVMKKLSEAYGRGKPAGFTIWRYGEKGMEISDDLKTLRDLIMEK